nr:hypothetical transcript [Hymenolepis microstoma]
MCGGRGIATRPSAEPQGRAKNGCQISIYAWPSSPADRRQMVRYLCSGRCRKGTNRLASTTKASRLMGKIKVVFETLHRISVKSACSRSWGRILALVASVGGYFE